MLYNSYIMTYTSKIYKKSVTVSHSILMFGNNLLILRTCNSETTSGQCFHFFCSVMWLHLYVLRQQNPDKMYKKVGILDLSMVSYNYYANMLILF